MFNENKFALLWFPSLRGNAYLNVLKETGKLPEIIVTMENDFFQQDKMDEEANRFHYKEQYFDHEYSIDKFAIEFDIKVIRTQAKSINDEMLSAVLSKIDIEYWLFTGGGILKNTLFEQGKQFLHIHPGKLPKYRGSTCFYYSLLEEGTLTASAFFLTPSLDKGNVIIDCNFSINVELGSQNKYFLDYVLDPYIRAQTLKKFIEQCENNSHAFDVITSEVTAKKVSESIDRTFYVMHPLLRALTIEKVNGLFDGSQPTGVFIIE